MTNTLFLQANVMMSLETGLTTQILLLANREDDATTFKPAEVDTYYSFVQRRVNYIEWSKVESKERPGFWVIRGIQNV
jgi:hypothetical protein